MNPAEPTARGLLELLGAGWVGAIPPVVLVKLEDEEELALFVVVRLAPLAVVRLALLVVVRFDEVLVPDVVDEVVLVVLGVLVNVKLDPQNGPKPHGKLVGKPVEKHVDGPD